MAALTLITVGILFALLLTHKAGARRDSSSRRVTALLESRARDPGDGALRQAIAAKEQAQSGLLVFAVVAAYGGLFMFLVDRESSSAPALLLTTPAVLGGVLACTGTVSPLAISVLLAFAIAGLLLLLHHRREAA